MINDSGRTQINVAAGGGDPYDRLLAQVREAATGVYDVLGEMGRSKSGNVVYLARELETTHLVALKLSRVKNSSDEEFSLEVVKTLDTSVPGLESRCPECKAVLPDWERFCFRCGADLSTAGAAPGVEDSAALLEAVKQATAGEYEILGQMSRADGGGPVYFAKELKRDKVVALRLKRDTGEAGEAAYSIGETQVFRPMAEDLGKTQVVSSYAPPSPPAAPPPEVTPSPSALPPLAASPAGAIPEPLVAPAPSAPTASKRAPIKALIGGGALALVALVAFLVLRGNGEDVRPATPPPAAEPPALPPPPPPPAPEPPAEPPPAPPAPAPSGPLAVDSGTIVISGALPPNATITLNGRPMRGSSFRAAPGTYTLGIAAAGYDPLSTQATVRSRQTFRWRATLAPSRSSAPPPPPHPEPPAAVTANCARAFGRSDWTAAAGLCAKEAQAGDPAAERMYGALLEQGRGASQDRVQAANWYRKAADGGDREAMVRLGYLLRRGDGGVKKDEKQSATWFKKAADLNDPTAALEYGVALENGDGIDKNEATAATFYKKAGDQGNPTALRRLGRLYERGKGVQKNEAEAATLYRSAADKGDGEAAYSLGKLYKDGKGVEKSSSQALEWFKKAVQLGNKAAAEEVKDLEKK